jgi:phage-related protein (TIGR01555 family)
MLKFFKKTSEIKKKFNSALNGIKYKRDMLKVFEASFQRNVSDFAQNPDTAMDALPTISNNILQYDRGTISDNILSWYGSHGFIGYQSCAILSQNWLVMRACSVPAKEAVRKGWDITVNANEDETKEVIEQLRNLDKKYKVNKNLVEFVQFGRVFGIRIAMFKVETPNPTDYYKKPFNIDSVTKGSYKGISQIDPYWVAPILDGVDASDPSSMTFYEPTYWTINGVTIHRSHLIIMRNVEVPDMLKPTYFYGGISVPQLIYERVYAAERTADEAPALALSKRLTVLQTDTEAALRNKEEFEQSLLQWAYYRDNFGVKVVGIDEKIEQFDTALGDLDNTIMTQYQLAASAANMPATKLLGTTPKGFNSTGQYEEQSYQMELESVQTHDLTPLLERHYAMCIKSDLGKDVFNFNILWKPTEAATELDKANINLTKAQTDQIYFDTGAIDGRMIHDRLIKDVDSGYDGLAENEDGEED